MSVGRNLLGKFGFIGGVKPKIASLESVLKLVEPSIQKRRVGGAKQWFSQSSRREFQSKELARRAVSESLARAPLVR
jgi:hypothetical protein